MKLEHTPGPWKVELYSGSIPKFRIWRVLIPHKTGIPANNSIISCGADSDEDREMEANAKLIAAMPEMYEACSKLCEWFADGFPLDDPGVGAYGGPNICCVCDANGEDDGEHAEGCPVPFAQAALALLETDGEVQNEPR